MAEYPSSLQGWADLFKIPVEKLLEEVEEYKAKNPNSPVPWDLIRNLLFMHLGPAAAESALAELAVMALDVLKTGKGPVGHDPLELGGV